MRWPGWAALVALLAVLAIVIIRACTPEDIFGVDPDGRDQVADGPFEELTYPWPLVPQDTAHVIGNQHAQYVLGYAHEGLDLLPSGTSRDVCAVRDGVVVMLTKAGYQSGLVIGDKGDGGKGTVYWHLKPGTLQFALGDEVAAGDKIAELTASFPVASFQHLHFEFVRGETDEGEDYWNHHEPTESPLTYLDPDTDAVPPTLIRDGATSLRFYRNESEDILEPDALSGEVDVVVQVEDLQLTNNAWLLTPYRLDVSIVRVGSGAVVYERALVLNGPLKEDDLESLAKVLCKTEPPAQTKGNYVQRQFFIVATNVDDDHVLETTDGSGAWDTTTLSDGLYLVRVSATDATENGVSETLKVVVDNSP